MKQYEVIVLRMRKQPFKTKLTPDYKIDWGKNYPQAKYPTRPKKQLHTFDIKEYVKNQKKKKLLEMMNAADQEDKANGLPMALPRMNRAHEELPPELQQIRERRKQEAAIPDFLQRKPVEETEAITEKKESRIPSFEEFKKQMEDSFNPFEDTDEVPVKKEPRVPERLEEDDDDDDGDDLGFDVDELVRKIDAKIAELEKEEQRNKEIEEQRKQEIQKEPAKVVEHLEEEPVEEVLDVLDGVSTTEDKPYSNSIENIYEEERKKPEVLDDIRPLPNINLDDDDDDDDFFDDFFDN
jgi:hypothetical protein